MNEKNNKRNVIISLIINMLVVLMTIAAVIIMFTGFKFMHGPDVILEATKLEMLKFFTVQSNIFVAVISLIFAIQECKLLKGKIGEISKRMYILKLMSTTSVGLTCFVVFAYLGPIAKYGIASLLMNSNLFLHLLIPVISIINFVCFEKTDKLKFKTTLFGMVPTFVYGAYYLINILVHMEDGKVSPIYDWYWFVQFGVWTAVIIVPLMLFISWLISLVIWKLNKIKIKQK